MSVITAFVNMLLKDQCATEVIPILFGANLIVLIKKSRAIRPIAVGYYWRRLSAKCANSFAAVKLTSYFSSIQLREGISGSYEAAVHTCQRFVLNMPKDLTAVKIDFSHSFRFLHRDSMLKSIKSRSPILILFFLSYSNDCILKFGNKQILSKELRHSIRQQLGPLIFCSAIHPIHRELLSPFTIGFIDDNTIGGPEPLIASGVKHTITKGGAFGFDLNFIKSEHISISITLTTDLIGEFSHYTTNNATLLSAPLVSGPTMNSALEKKQDDLKRASECLWLTSVHEAHVLLRASCSASKFMHIMYSSPCAGDTLLSDINNSLHPTPCTITNIDITNNGDKLAFKLRLEV